MRLPSVTAPARIAWLDYVKGIAIILVVIGHAIRGLRVEIVGPRLLDYLVLDRLIYSFHMPLFFRVSGLLFARRASSDLVSFSRAMAIGIVVPYVVWSIAFVLLQSLAPDVNHRYSPNQLLGIWKAPIGHMWFLYAMLHVQVVFYLALRFLSKPKQILIGSAFLSAYLLPESLPWINAIAPGAAMGGAFFGLGLLAASGNLISLIQYRMAAVFAAVLWCALVISSDIPTSFSSPLAAASGTAMILAACWLIKDVRAPITALLGFLGQCSMAIFVAHTIFSAGLRIVLYRVGIYDCDVHVISGTLIGVAAPAVLFTVASQLKISPYVGLGRSQLSLATALSPREFPRAPTTPG